MTTRPQGAIKSHPQKWYTLPSGYIFVRDWLKALYPGPYDRQIKGNLLRFIRQSGLLMPSSVYKSSETLPLHKFAVTYDPSKYRDLRIASNHRRLVALGWKPIAHFHVEEFGICLEYKLLHCEFCRVQASDSCRVFLETKRKGNCAVCEDCREDWLSLHRQPEELIRLEYQLNALRRACVEAYPSRKKNEYTNPKDPKSE